MDEQECSAGAVEGEVVMCGMRSRICDESCHWRPWSAVSGAGECEAGTREVVVEGCAPGEIRDRTCLAECSWSELSECAARCIRAARPSRSGADPVCISEGPFSFGVNPGIEGGPLREFSLSEYFIDRYAITVERLRQCVDAGTCLPPEAWVDGEPTDPPDALVRIDIDQARAFCDWDGGNVPLRVELRGSGKGHVYPVFAYRATPLLSSQGGRRVAMRAAMSA